MTIAGVNTDPDCAFCASLGFDEVPPIPKGAEPDCYTNARGACRVYDATVDGLECRWRLSGDGQLLAFFVYRQKGDPTEFRSVPFQPWAAMYVAPGYQG